MEINEFLLITLDSHPNIHPAKAMQAVFPLQTRAFVLSLEDLAGPDIKQNASYRPFHFPLQISLSRKHKRHILVLPYLHYVAINKYASCKIAIGEKFYLYDSSARVVGGSIQYKLIIEESSNNQTVEIPIAQEKEYSIGRKYQPNIIDTTISRHHINLKVLPDKEVLLTNYSNSGLFVARNWIELSSGSMVIRIGKGEFMELKLTSNLCDIQNPDVLMHQTINEHGSFQAMHHTTLSYSSNFIVEKLKDHCKEGEMHKIKGKYLKYNSIGASIDGILEVVNEKTKSGATFSNLSIGIDFK
jgi:hypothetical protein